MNYENTYESTLVQIMAKEGVTLSQALTIDMLSNGIDVGSVFDSTDYLEQKFDLDMNKVRYFMGVFSGVETDLRLKKD